MRLLNLRPRTTPGEHHGKRVVDIVGALTLIILGAPALLVTALLIKIGLGRPVFFRQVRPGYYEKPFTLLKFRTMRDAFDAEGNALQDCERLTRVGIWLRRYSLDELPELWNVLRGDMSLVGPRPLLMRYLPYFSHEERRRFKVRPGITGLAQVSGRNDVSWRDRIAYDVSYVRNWSLFLDFKILSLTLWRVLRQHGVQVDPGRVMQDFDEERRSQLHD